MFLSYVGLPFFILFFKFTGAILSNNFAFIHWSFWAYKYTKFIYSSTRIRIHLILIKKKKAPSHLAARPLEDRRRSTTPDLAMADRCPWEGKGEWEGKEGKKKQKFIGLRDCLEGWGANSIKWVWELNPQENPISTIWGSQFPIIAISIRFYSLLK